MNSFSSTPLYRAPGFSAKADSRSTPGTSPSVTLAAQTRRRTRLWHWLKLARNSQSQPQQPASPWRQHTWSGPSE